ncbi:MAG: peptidyl-alpha-hydroxyglycine alpha-amidating lyase family protein [Dehalococcoidia bacterium]
MAIVGEGDFRYEVDTSWPKKIPEYWTLGLCSDVAVDSQDRVWVYSRGKHPVTIWTADGEFIGSWGNQGNSPGEFKVPHGIFIDSDDNVWLTDTQTHLVTKHRPDGEVLMELGTRDYANITVTTNGMQGTPFNMPTGVAIASDGDIFTSDGYGNRQVHRFSSDGQLKSSWGRAGTGPGEFAILHKVAVDERDRVFICDRENNRIQVFDVDGEYIEEWSDVVGPGDVYFAPDHLVYVVEQGGGNGVSIWTLDGELITRWRGNKEACESAHGLWTDSKGDIYVAEIGQPGHGQRVRKFVRVR